MIKTQKQDISKSGFPLEKRRCWKCGVFHLMERRILGDRVEYYCDKTDTVIYSVQKDADTKEYYPESEYYDFVEKHDKEVEKDDR